MGKRWNGIAISDHSRTFAQPYATVESPKLFTDLERIITRERPAQIIVGHPITMRDTASAQTIAVETIFVALQKRFPHEQWLLWDERLTSYTAQIYLQAIGKKSRHSEHAIAAACLLETYLASLKG